MVGHGGVNGRVVHTRNGNAEVVSTNGILTANVSGVTGITRLGFRTAHLPHPQI
ncbi:hypothetical protein FDE04_03910 [Vibrio parahaemolyticus]|nr:hypothetical protein [Vibrio parahaemolyticus]EGQ9244260.1 hypothetical protein [Vibrio parahaemolyticus]EGR0997528.1 hypothetical protein [Vibrio parahaemolyticus]EGR1897393.1 hypothetical protein [Vibrio parahaemolyticus]EGR1920780.1 hypothetical protein [Vibrio parahaemolyticus]